MLVAVLSLLLLTIPAFAAPPKYPRRSQTVFKQPVTWVTHFDSIPADTDVRLQWGGGDGHGWQVYFIPQWHKQLEYQVSLVIQIVCWCKADRRDRLWTLRATRVRPR